LRNSTYFCKFEPLQDLESASQLTGEQPVTTVTFFTGSSAESAVPVLKERIRQLVMINPWLVGRIVKNNDHKNLQIAFPHDAYLPQDVMDELFRVDPPDCKFDFSTPYDELVSTILGSSANLPVLDMPTFSSEFESNLLVTRITLVSDSKDASAFGLVVSMSHVIADGATYYQIMNMLSFNSSIKPLVAKRNMEGTSKIVELQGEEDYNFMLGSGLTFNAVGGLAFGKKAKMFCHYVDDAKMAAAKVAAKSQCEEQGVKYVSSNDILVSTMASVTKPRLWMMAMNFRGRVKDIDPALAGNYEGCCWLDESVYSNPAAIRKAMQGPSPMIFRTTPLPGTWEMGTSAKLGNCSNWASFGGEDLVLGQAIQRLHFPLIRTNKIPFENVCLFRPKAGTMAVMILSKLCEREAYLEGMPLGADVFA